MGWKRRFTDLEVVDLLADIVEVALGEDNTDVAYQLGEDVGPHVIAASLAVQTDGTLHHGVLAHEDGGVTAETLCRRGCSKCQAACDKEVCQCQAACDREVCKGMIE